MNGRIFKVRNDAGQENRNRKAGQLRSHGAKTKALPPGPEPEEGREKTKSKQVKKDRRTQVNETLIQDQEQFYREYIQKGQEVHRPAMVDELFSPPDTPAIEQKNQETGRYEKTEAQR